MFSNLTFTKTIFLTFLVFTLLFAFVACGDDEVVVTTTASEEVEEIKIIEKSTPYPEKETKLSIAEIAVDGGFNTLVAALDAADLVETLSGEGTFTVFAPTDDAFAALPEGMLEELLADPETLKQILLYHVVGDVVMAETVVTLDEAETLEGSIVSIDVVDGNVFLNDSQVTSTDIEASNGVVHVIDKVLVPGMQEAASNETPEESKSIAEIAVAGGFNTLVAALSAADLVETLSGEGTFTVFAPTDDAFAALPEGMLEELLADPETLKQILLYHVVGDVVMAETVVTLDEAETLEGSIVSIDVVDGNVFLNDSQVTSTDIEASNGVVHVIDKVLVPGMQEAASNETPEESKSIAEIAVAGGFNTLVAALSAADLVETLSGDGAFTVFAPTDDAFAALPEGMLEGLLADTESLTQILLYHVVGDVVMADTVVTLDEAETLEGSKVEIEVVDGKVFVNDSQVTTTDIEASNGVIHVIDKVLVPGMDETGNNKKLIDDQIPNFVVYEYSDAETDYTFRRLVIRDIIESTLEKSSTKTQISQQIPVGIYETSQVQLSSVIPLGLIEAQIPQVF